MFKGIEHFAIASPDPQRLADYYVATLGFKVNHAYGGNFFVEAPGGGLIEIIPADGERPVAAMRTPGLRHVAIEVDDFDGAYQQLMTQGVSFEAEPYENEGNRLVFFKDVDGNLLHLIKRQKPIR